MMQCILVMNAYFPPIGQWNPCYKGINPGHIIPKLRGRFSEPVILKAGWGRGIQKIFEVCNEYGALQPKYVVHSEDIMIKLAAVSIFDKHVLKLDSKAENTALKMKIVEYLQNQPTATQKELQEVLNETRTHIQKIIKELVGEGKIVRAWCCSQSFFCSSAVYS